MLKLDRWIERALVVAGLLLLAAGAFHMYSTLSANAGAARVEARQHKAEAAGERARRVEVEKREVVLAASLDSASKAARASSARFTAAAADFETARDTLTITDTVSVREALNKATAAVAAARAAQAKAEEERASAQALLAVKDERIDSLERENASIRRQIAATERQIPSRFGRTLTAAKWLAVGIGAGAVLTR